ncbi:carbohydrate-binding protein [Amycolatopsis regifaucium]|uniref:Dioxygenase n=1 Tax=Amycolatopsis regifaucium TaxID=546365 RepID=A0A154MSK4_9PSEU|nr:carbohydrate-binding protein [Amycolatopsis regifaucium]KZB86963.1 dioxygenase [Amycolatopsis regifaucium]OKA09392.1 dioxygenase [Amycolatopsis regifaucium]SFH60014.1 Protocatechuate 3,4-dioxygenase beta subunit [Amycolatopsis regifaucium]
MDEENKLSRKTVLRAALAAGVAAPVALIGGPALARTTVANGKAPELTPACDDGDDPTPPQTEGPYFKPNSPQRTSLVTSGTPGTRLTVSGYVFGLGCLPIARALLDFWQADVNGAYDNVGYTFRGHQFTNDQGAFTLSTIVPGLYPGRTRHIHVKVQAPGRPVLTTQLYFPNEPRNNTDSIFDPRLLMTVRDSGSAKEAAFDFVLNVPQTPTSTSRPTSTTPTTSTSTSNPPGGTTWAAGTGYSAGARVTYSGRGYVCLQAHTAQPGWEPPSTPALWRAE